jgi:hypothetical protein
MAGGQRERRINVSGVMTVNTERRNKRLVTGNKG